MNKTKPNAQHGTEPKTSYLMVRVTPKQKAAYVKAADGKKLSAWVTAILDTEASNSNDIALIKQEVIKCFGLNPYSCDSMLTVPAHRYNNLVELLNKL